MEAADPRDGETCPVFNAKLRLFENASAPVPPADHPDDLTLATIDSQHVPVVNTTEQAIAVDDEILVGQTIDERWVIINGGTGSPRIQFVTTGKMAGQQVEVKVLRVHGAAPDLSGGVLEFGSTLNVTDPFNLWAEVEPDATGWAYYVAQSEDDPDTGGVTEPTHPARYEIEECSLPIKELEGTIETCLKKEDDQKDVTIDLMGGDVRSSYPCVDEPPEASESGIISADNTYNLDAVSGSKVFIRRKTDLKPSTPEDFDLGSGSATQADWEIIRVEKKIARWTGCRWTGTEWQQTGSVWDGFDPFEADCPPPFSAASVACLPKESTEGIACYNPESHLYVVVSTASALLGPPAKHQVLQGTDSQGNQNISFDTLNCPTVTMNYQVMDLYGWSEDETMEDCAEKNQPRSAYLALASVNAMTTPYLCAGTCTFTSTLVNNVWTWVGSGCTVGCSCSYGSGSLPDPSDPANQNQTIDGTCGNPVDGQGGLCFATTQVLACPSPIAGPVVCIPVTDCPEDTTGDP